MSLYYARVSKLPFSRLSLKTKLITNYLVILGIGGLVTSIVGSWIVSATIRAQARRSVDRDLRMARALYDQQLETLERTVALAASGSNIPRLLERADRAGLAAYLEPVRRGAAFDFLTLADERGRVLIRSGAGR